MKKRLNFECWNCKREFTLMVPIDEKPDILSECPYCASEVLIELNPDRNKKITVFKNGSEAETPEDFEFPTIIPTREPNQEEPPES